MRNLTDPKMRLPVYIPICEINMSKKAALYKISDYRFTCKDGIGDLKKCETQKLDPKRAMKSRLFNYVPQFWTA